jgi:hypothetical protein
MVPSQLIVPSTFRTMSGWGNSWVPILREDIVRGSMKLWMAPQSSSALSLVVLCHMLTVKEIVIEFFWVLYMLATTARVLVTSKLWQTKNPGPCHRRPGIWTILRCP